MSPAVKDFKTIAYNQLKNTDQLSFYKETYDTSHTDKETGFFTYAPQDLAEMVLAK